MFRRGVLLATVCLVAAATACAEDLKLTVRGLIPRFRSQAPLPLECILNWNGSELIEGTLSLEVRDSAQLLVRYENPDVALSFGDLNLRFVLPPLSNEADTVEVRARFRSPKWGTFDLGQHTLSVPADWRRHLLIGLVVLDGDRSPRAAFSYLDGLDLSRFRPTDDGVVNGAAGSGGLNVADVRVSARDLPTRAAPLCAFDLLAFAGGSLSELRSRQREAILDWIDAGGSVYVDATGTMDAADASFLNELALRTRGDDGFLIDSNGRLSSDTAHVLARRGLGRVVIATAAAGATSDATRIACWLWKLSRRSEQQITESGTWVRSPPRSNPLAMTAPGMQPGFVADAIESGIADDLALHIPPYAPIPQPSATMLPVALLPDRVETVPMPVVIGVLCLFLFVIAPGDWLLLGVLRRRMLTWLFFPAACVVFTVVMVVLANRYIGREDYRTAIRFVDRDAANRVVRVTAVETMFTATAQPVRLELRDTLFSSVDTVGKSEWQGTVVGGQSQYTNVARLDAGSDPPPTFEGRPTNMYSLMLPVRKWTPVVSRYSYFSAGLADESEDEIDWAGLDRESVAADPDAAAETLMSRNPGALAVVLCGDRRSSLPDASSRLRQFLQFAVAVSKPEPEGFFRIAAAVSPNGHRSLEDLAVFDSSDPEQVLVLVLRGSEAGYVVDRRVFFGESNR